MIDALDNRIAHALAADTDRRTRELFQSLQPFVDDACATSGPAEDVAALFWPGVFHAALKVCGKRGGQWLALRSYAGPRVDAIARQMWRAIKFQPDPARAAFGPLDGYTFTAAASPSVAPIKLREGTR